MASLLDRLVKRTDDVLGGEVQLAGLMCPAIKVLAQGAASDSHVVTVDQVVLQ